MDGCQEELVVQGQQPQVVHDGFVVGVGLVVGRVVGSVAVSVVAAAVFVAVVCYLGGERHAAGGRVEGRPLKGGVIGLDVVSVLGVLGGLAWDGKAGVVVL